MFSNQMYLSLLSLSSGDFHFNPSIVATKALRMPERDDEWDAEIDG